MRFGSGRRSSRRGVSEIVSTLMLVAMVVSLGVIVFTFASGGLSSLTGNFTGLMGTQADADLEHLVVEQVTFSGVGGVMSLDGHANGGTASGTSFTVTLTTTSPNDIVIVHAYSSAGAVQSVTSAHLTFTDRKPINAVSHFMSEWYAVASSALSAEVITVSFGATTVTASGVAFGVSGANTASPFDPASGFPYTSSGASSAPSVTGIATSYVNDLTIGLEGNSGSSANTAGTLGGVSMALADQGTTSGARTDAEYLAVSSLQSSATMTFGTSVTNWIMFSDALAPASGASVYLRNVGSVASTVVSVFVVDQSTNSFVGQFPVSLVLNAGSYTVISSSTLGFLPAHGHSYSFTVTSQLGNSVEFIAKAT